MVAPALAMRGLTSDSTYLASLLSQIKGPVVLAAHSYGGAVISNAATRAKNVKALVFVNAFATTAGEVLSAVEKGSTDSALNPALQQFTYPTGASTKAVELLVDPAKFPAVFGADLPYAQGALLAATQRPIAASAFNEAAGPPAWKRLPSWAVMGRRRHRRQGRGDRHHPLDGQAGPCAHRRPPRLRAVPRRRAGRRARNRSPPPARREAQSGRVTAWWFVF